MQKIIPNGEPKMRTEEVSMIAWAYEHPFLYFGIEIAPTGVALIIIILMNLMFNAIKLNILTGKKGGS